MDFEAFCGTFELEHPPTEFFAPLLALWWDAKGNWARAHELVDSLKTKDGMAVHAYLHRKEGEQWNADYWYRMAGRTYHRAELSDEWQALVDGLLNGITR